MIHTILLCPLIGALIIGLLSREASASIARIFTSALMILAATLSWFVFYDVVVLHHTYLVDLCRWFDVGNFTASWAIRVDSLTAVMLVVVNTVSCLVHIYSIGYMHDDPHVPRFMAYLSLFTFFMLMLVTADNLVQLFLGWEGVGLCSYLLIGFWFEKESACNAAIKAFIVNRVGDFAFCLGLFTIFSVFNSIEFGEIFAHAGDFQGNKIKFIFGEFDTITVICILLFIGAMGKSAQIGLHTWLPDAMEGPTPVSALIHAATMVTAGVFLVARFSPLFEYSEVARGLVTCIGAVTCLFAATIAITQNDIKKIIAYSTCSQLGYMFFACGVSAYSAGIFHLMTHAFFKALLFLGAGSVIHAMSGEQDIKKMGGLASKIPFTFTMMLLGSLALAGVYPFAGFYSKDIVLEAAYASGTDAGIFAYWFGIIAAFLTAFYSWRLLILVFNGKTRAPSSVYKNVHESPLSMTIPLLILSIGAVFAGKGGDLMGMVNPESAFWGESIKVMGENVLEKAHHVPFMIKFMPLLAGFAGIFLSYMFYWAYPGTSNIFKHSFYPLYRFLANKWYFDEIYDYLLVKPTKLLGLALWKIFDVKIIDGLGPNGFAFLSNISARFVSKAQNGILYQYAFIMILGLMALVTWFVYNFFVV